MEGQVTHPTGTTYFIFTVPPGASDGDLGVFRQSLHDALKEANKVASIVALYEERHVVGPNGELD